MSRGASTIGDETFIEDKRPIAVDHGCVEGVLARRLAPRRCIDEEQRANGSGPRKRLLASNDAQCTTNKRLLRRKRRVQDDASRRDSKSSMMPRRLEVVKTGTLFHWSVTARVYSPLGRWTFTMMVGLFLPIAESAATRQWSRFDPCAPRCQRERSAFAPETSAIVPIGDVSIGEMFQDHGRRCRLANYSRRWWWRNGYTATKATGCQSRKLVPYVCWSFRVGRAMPLPGSAARDYCRLVLFALPPIVAPSHHRTRWSISAAVRSENLDSRSRRRPMGCALVEITCATIVVWTRFHLASLAQFPRLTGQIAVSRMNDFRCERPRRFNGVSGAGDLLGPGRLSVPRERCIYDSSRWCASDIEAHPLLCSITAAGAKRWYGRSVVDYWQVNPLNHGTASCASRWRSLCAHYHRIGLDSATANRRRTFDPYPYWDRSRGQNSAAIPARNV